MEQEQQTPHKRRVRYKGKYPKKFEEKYKELQPEKYQDTIEHVIKKGNTPAGMHISIMVQEILDTLNIQPGETGFDATLAYVSSIEGNEVTYMEVDESVAKAVEERAKEKAKAEDGAGSDSTEQSGQMQMPPDMDSTEMPQGAPGGMSDMTGETVTTMIPVGVTVHTTSDTTTTFSRLASGDLLKILVETDSDGNEVIEEIWMLQ